MWFNRNPTIVNDKITENENKVKEANIIFSKILEKHKGTQTHVLNFNSNDGEQFKLTVDNNKIIINQLNSQTSLEIDSSLNKIYTENEKNVIEHFVDYINNKLSNITKIVDNGAMTNAIGKKYTQKVGPNNCEKYEISFTTNGLHVSKNGSSVIDLTISSTDVNFNGDLSALQALKKFEESKVGIKALNLVGKNIQAAKERKQTHQQI